MPVGFKWSRWSACDVCRALSRDRERAKISLWRGGTNANAPDETAWMLVFATQGYQMQDKETQDQFL